jgi:hypothetical protein
MFSKGCQFINPLTTSLPILSTAWQKLALSAIHRHKSGDPRPFLANYFCFENFIREKNDAIRFGYKLNGPLTRLHKGSVTISMPTKNLAWMLLYLSNQIKST